MSNTFKLPKQGLGKAGVLAKLDDALAKEPDALHGNMACYAMKGSEDLQDVISQAYQKYFFFNGLVQRYFPGYQSFESP